MRKQPIELRFIAKMSQVPTERTSNGRVWHCLEWIHGADSRGYGRLWSNEQKATVLTHRLSWSIYHQQEVPSGMQVRHKCDNPRCVNPCHLELGTAQDNTNDMMERNRNVSQKGVNQNKAKLTEEQVKLIRVLYAAGQTIAELSRSYKVAHSTIGRIVRREHWRHL